MTENHTVTRPVLPQRLDWSSVIGLFILNFGSLEVALSTVIQRFLDSERRQAVTKDTFHDKVSRLRKLAKELPEMEAQKERWNALIERLDGVRDLRNHLAHSTLVITLTEDDSASVQALSLISDLSASAAEARVVEFDELFQQTAHLADIIGDLLALGDASIDDT